MRNSKFKILVLCSLLFHSALTAQVYALKQTARTSYTAPGTIDIIPIAITTNTPYLVTVLQTVEKVFPNKRSLMIRATNKTTGALIWEKKHTNADNVDPAGLATYYGNTQIHVLSTINRTNGRSALLCTIYNTSGVFIKEMVWESLAYTKITASKIEVDNKGNIYVLGNGYSSLYQKTDMIFLKYATDGSSLFVKNYSTSIDNTFSVLKATTSAVYLVGKAGTQNSKIITLAYDLNGNKLWEAAYNGSLNLESKAADAEILNDGLYVLGNSDNNMVTIKYNLTNGTLLWLQRYDGPGNRDVAVDLDISEGRIRLGGANIPCESCKKVCVTGYSDGTNSAIDMVTISYDLTTGALKWVQRYNGQFNGDDLSVGVKTDMFGNVYLVGTEQDLKLNKYGNYEKNNIVLLYGNNGKFLNKKVFRYGNSFDIKNPIVLSNHFSQNPVNLSIGFRFEGVNLHPTSIPATYEYIQFKWIDCFGYDAMNTVGTGVSGVLKFDNLETFNLVLDSLAMVDDDSISNANLTTSKGYSSLYSKIEADEEAILASGGFPGEDGAPDPDFDAGVDDEALRQLLNSNGEVMIGDVLYKFGKNDELLTIYKPTQTLLDGVRNNDPTALKNPRLARVTQEWSGGGLKNGVDFYYEILNVTETTMEVLFTPYGNPPISTCVWDFGDGNTSLDEAGGSNIPISHIFDLTSTSDNFFDVSYTITKCQSVSSLEGVSATHPVNSVSLTKNACNASLEVVRMVDGLVEFKNYSEPAVSGVEWSFGDPLNSKSIIYSPTFTYTAPGTYTVTMKLTGGTCNGETYSVDVLICEKKDNTVCSGGCVGERQRKKLDQQYANNTRRVKCVAWYKNIGSLNYFRVGQRIRSYQKASGGLRKWKGKSLTFEISVVGKVLLGDDLEGTFPCQNTCTMPKQVEKYYKFRNPSVLTTTLTTKDTGKRYPRLRANFKVRKINNETSAGAFEYGTTTRFYVCKTDKLKYSFKFKDLTNDPYTELNTQLPND